MRGTKDDAQPEGEWEPEGVPGSEWERAWAREWMRGLGREGDRGGGGDRAAAGDQGEEVGRGLRSGADGEAWPGWVGVDRVEGRGSKPRQEGESRPDWPVNDCEPDGTVRIWELPTGANGSSPTLRDEWGPEDTPSSTTDEIGGTTLMLSRWRRCLSRMTRGHRDQAASGSVLLFTRPGFKISVNGNRDNNTSHNPNTNLDGSDEAAERAECRSG